MKTPDIRALIKRGSLFTEMDYERAMLADRTLRLLAEKDDSLLNLRNDLRSLIAEYESAKWSDINSVTDQQLSESQAAENLVAAERIFYIRRKEIILSRLTELGLIQKDLGILLDHNKSYTSELLNGIRAFSSTDLILIHKLLKIDLNDLFPTIVPVQIQKRIAASISKVSAKNLVLKPSEFELASL